MGSPRPKPKLTKGGTREWSAGDRIGKTYPTHLSEHLVRVGIGRPIDPEVYTLALESCLNVIAAIHEADALDEVDIPIEEVPDAIKQLNAIITREREEATEKETTADQRYDDLVSEQAGTDKDHAEDIKEHCAIIDELRKRAELAEHERDELRALLAPYTKPMRKRSAAPPVRVVKMDHGAPSFAAVCAESASKAANEHGGAVTLTITPEKKR